LAECIVPGCGLEGVHNLGIRLRRPDANKTAIWAPNLDAFLCDVPATSGARISILYESTETRQIETHVHVLDPFHSERITDIRNPARLDEDLKERVRKVRAT
jgi:hypothetical protein